MTTRVKYLGCPPRNEAYGAWFGNWVIPSNLCVKGSIKYFQSQLAVVCIAINILHQKSNEMQWSKNFDREDMWWHKKFNVIGMLILLDWSNRFVRIPLILGLFVKVSMPLQFDNLIEEKRLLRHIIMTMKWVLLLGLLSYCVAELGIYAWNSTFKLLITFQPFAV